MIKVGSEPFLECSTKGDRRFSAFCAKIKSLGNKSIEELYQAFKKFRDENGNIVTGLSWRDAKGKTPINQEECKAYYSHLWDLYFSENPHLLEVIKQYNGFSDIFGQPGRCCQAIEIYRIRQSLVTNSNSKQLNF